MSYFMYVFHNKATEFLRTSQLINNYIQYDTKTRKKKCNHIIRKFSFIEREKVYNQMINPFRQ